MNQPLVAHGIGSYEMRSEYLMTGAVSNQILWIGYQPLDRFPAPVLFLPKKFFRLKGHRITHDIKGRPRQLIRQRLVRYHPIVFACLSIEKSTAGLIIASGELGCFRKGPCQILVAVFLVAVSFLFSVGCP